MFEMKLLLILGTLSCLVGGEDLKATLKSLVVTSDIKVRYARTLVSAEYFNDKNSPAIAHFHVILPDRAYISNFSMEINGNVTVGVVREKEEAKEIFEQAVSRGESAGHVSVRHRDTRTFVMKVNVEPNVKAIFNLTYEELLKRNLGKYTHRIFISDEITERILIEIFISEPQEINVFEDSLHKDHSVRSVEYIDNKHVYIRFDPSREEQEKLKELNYLGEFIVEYDVKRAQSNVIYELDGYFVHFFTPVTESVWPKNIVFMIDISGSMRGRKLRQVKAAMLSILSALEPDKDSFTFGTFSSNVNWEQTRNLTEAKKFVSSLYANGDTDINQAVLTSLDKIQNEHSSHMVNILFFLTDGDPTSGVINKEEIRRNIKNANDRKVMIFTLGFGENCDLQFLQNIADDNDGFSRKIFYDEDSDTQIKTMYQEISSLLLKNVIITYVDNTVDVGNVTQHEFKTIFNGTEIAIAGPIKEGMKKSHNITVEFKAENAEKTFLKTEVLTFSDISFDDIFPFDESPVNPNLTKLDMLPNISKKTWAYLTLQKMFEDGAPNEDIVDLAIKNNFVTPLTSMVVTKKQLQEEGSVKIRKKANRKPARKPGRRLSRVDNGLPGLADPIRSAPLRPGKITPQMRILFSFRPTAITAAATTTTTTTTTTAATTTTATTTTTPTPAITPRLTKFPGVIVKPYNCDVMLCPKKSDSCINATRLLLLKDSRSGITVYGEQEKPSSVTCLDNLYKLIIIFKRRNIEITPSLLTVNRREQNYRGKNIRFNIKKFLQVHVFNRDINARTLSVNFIVKDYMKMAKGLYGNFMKRFDCTVQPTGELTLSHTKSVTYSKVGITSPEDSIDSCYM